MLRRLRSTPRIPKSWPASSVRTSGAAFFTLLAFLLAGLFGTHRTHIMRLACVCLWLCVAPVPLCMLTHKPANRQALPRMAGMAAMQFALILPFGCPHPPHLSLTQPHREFDFVLQQQAAMKLSKLAPAGSAEAAAYSWWVVTALVLQARAALLGQDQQGRPLVAAGGSAAAGGGAAAAGASLPPDKLLQLAESMAGRQAKAAEAAAAAKQGQAGKAAAMAAVGWSYEALLLYLDILQGQGKAREALQVRPAVLVWEQLL